MASKSLKRLFEQINRPNPTELDPEDDYHFIQGQPPKEASKSSFDQPDGSGGHQEGAIDRDGLVDVGPSEMRIKLCLDSNLTELEQKYPTQPISLKKWTEDNSQDKEEAERERALGLTKEQYDMILDSQRDRGAYVPPTFWIKQKAICKMDDGSETGDWTTEKPTRQSREAFNTLMDRMEAKLSKQIVRKATTTTKGGPIGVHKVGPDLMDREEDLLESGLEMEMDEVT
ncbi:hypothetical protein PPACK8108_LOCUS21763 [Phakopsora pachyrhizi]|uniref:Uncharacterized protein n=1 Tax=Phakopsora pachyrhizi TaxID=170000 RepID=A0AAV0BK43_PHAPC|nr:hypothetical protein PPACK8108_LOCUS21763 [Phakopsora pachyrhizi]